MPYKSSDKQREANREIQRRKRQGVTDKGVTQQGVTLLKRPNGEGYDPSEMLGNRKRYMVMKDGQVLDRQTLPHLINDEVTNQGSPRIEFIKTQLTSHIVKDIEATIAYFKRIGNTSWTPEERYERAYKYRQWRDSRQYQPTLYDRA